MAKKIVVFVGLLCSNSMFALDDEWENWLLQSEDPIELVSDDPQGIMSTNANENSDTSYPLTDETAQVAHHQPVSNSPVSSTLDNEIASTTVEQNKVFQTASTTTIHLHEVDGQLVGYIENVGHFPVFVSPGLMVITQAQLEAYRDGIIAQAHRAYSAPFGSPIAANSITKTPTDDSMEKNSSEQDSNDSVSSNPRAGQKRNRTHEMGLAKQPQAQNSDPLEKFVGDNFDALIKCAFQNTGAQKPVLNNLTNSWQINITDIKSLLDCTYRSSNRTKKATKLEHQIKAVKKYFSDWPKAALKEHHFTVSIKSKSEQGSARFQRVQVLLSQFAEASVHAAAESELEPSTKRKKTKE